MCVVGIALCGCVAEDAPSTKKGESPASVPATGPVKKVPVGKNVDVEIQGDKRRVVIQSTVCLRMGPLEQLLTRKQTKEHESILVADVDAQHIHAALLVAGAQEGKPVQFRPRFQPPTGTPIKVTLEYTDPEKKQLVQVAGQHWIRRLKDNKELQADWVFAGSRKIADPLEKQKPPYYAANDGDIICVSNFDTAMLDLPILSGANADELAFDAFTSRIPPLETPVKVILEPILR